MRTILHVRNPINTAAATIITTKFRFIPARLLLLALSEQRARSAPYGLLREIRPLRLRDSSRPRPIVVQTEQRHDARDVCFIADDIAHPA